MKFKHYLIIFLAFLALVALVVFSQGQAKKEKIDLRDDPATLNIYFFRGEGCPHCAKEEEFLNALEKTNQQIDVYSFEIWNDADNRKLLQKVGESLDFDVSGVPVTIIGTKSLIGYDTDETTGKTITEMIAQCRISNCDDPVAAIVGLKPMDQQETPAVTATTTSDESASKMDKIKLPFLGEVDPTTISLPVLTVVIGLLDGFNPCAMWTLVFLITLLLGMGNKKRMWILGTAFIAGSAAMYFLFMAAWLNLLLFIGFIVWVRIIIGMVALGSGVYSIREYFVNKDSTCKVTQGEEKQKVFGRIRNAVKQQSFWLALGGILVLAFAVNLVELICSAGLPAIYTQVLTLSSIPTWQYYLYLLGYIFFYMLDDMLVFVASMITLQLTGLTNKYTRWARLGGGILILILGVLLIFKPAWLMFG